MSSTQQIKSRKQFELFFKTNYEDMVRYALKFVKQSDVAADIVQEAFVKLWENKDHIISTVPIKAYLFKVIYNLSLNHIEQVKVRSKHHQTIYTELQEMELDFFHEERSLIQDENQALVRKLIEELPDDCQKVIRLSRFDGLKNKEIAKKLTIPVRTVETRIYRCINKLRKFVDVSRNIN